MNVQAVLKRLEHAKPQDKLDLMEGMTIRKTKSGIPIVRLHYTVIPERRTKEWHDAERRKYTSQAAWDREQEIVDNAGGGELVVADTLISHWDKIVITDPKWRPDPMWEVEGGFDHGKRNPTSLGRVYCDYAGTFYACGEYYMPGKEIWEHAPMIKKMEDVRKLRACFADPSIFPQNIQQSQKPGEAPQRAKSVNELYCEQGIELFSPFAGDRSDVSLAARLHAHWADLDNREPTFKIVCRNYSEQLQPGLHQWDCPNLLWELMRWRRVKPTAQYLLTHNTSEAIVDKDNHAIDGTCKYVLMSHPEPSVKTKEQRAQEAVKPLVEAGDLTSASIRYQQKLEEEQGYQQPARIGRYYRRR